jgi:hypothetical protein
MIYAILFVDNQKSESQSSSAQMPTVIQPQLMLDVLSPTVNVERLLSEQQAAQSQQQTVLSLYENLSSYSPSETDLRKEFEKLVRSFKILISNAAGNRERNLLIINECFTLSESIRQRAAIFHIPELVHSLKSIIDEQITQFLNSNNSNNNNNGESIRHLKYLQQCINQVIASPQSVTCIKMNHPSANKNKNKNKNAKKNKSKSTTPHLIMNKAKNKSHQQKQKQQLQQSVGNQPSSHLGMAMTNTTAISSTTQMQQAKKNSNSTTQMRKPRRKVLDPRKQNRQI